MTTTGPAHHSTFESRFDALDDVSLIDTIIRRRSRRFSLGSELDGGPLTYRSAQAPVPLTVEEEAIIVFAGSGANGSALGEAPYAPGRESESSSGNIMTGISGRTIASPDGLNTAILFVINDEGAFQIRRPGDYPRESLGELAELARRHEFVELYERAKIRVADHRAEVLRQPPFTPPFNRWSANLPGSTYFVIVSDVTPLVLSLLFFLLNEEMAMCIFDDRAHYRPAGLKRFMRSKGGWLHDDPNDARVAGIIDLESYVMELLGVEQGLMLQNMQLAVEGLGLGGFPHFGAQKYQWFEELGFRMEDVSLAKLTRRSRVVTAAMNAMGKNPIIPHPLGLEVDGEVTIKPYSPPWYGSMQEAVHAFVERKFGDNGTFADGRTGPWQDNVGVQAGIDHYTQANIDAVAAYAEYVYANYGRFPGNFGPLRSLMAYQAHHVDLEFYDRLYTPGSYYDVHHEHFARWHENGAGAQ